jgi:hypothetical protein
MASPASIRASSRRRCSASSRSKSPRGLQSAGREPALRPRRKCPPRSIEAEFYFPKNLDLESRTDAMVAPIHWPASNRGENMGVGLSFRDAAGTPQNATNPRRTAIPPPVLDFIWLFLTVHVLPTSVSTLRCRRRHPLEGFRISDMLHFCNRVLFLIRLRA